MCRGTPDHTFCREGWDQTSSYSCPSAWAHGSCWHQYSWAVAESGFTRWSQIASPDFDLAPGHSSMESPHYIMVLNSDHTRPEEGLWPQDEPDACAKLSPTGSMDSCCVQGSAQSIANACNCLGTGPELPVMGHSRVASWRALLACWDLFAPSFPHQLTCQLLHITSEFQFWPVRKKDCVAQP